jgi:hypothetical protein
VWQVDLLQDWFARGGGDDWQQEDEQRNAESLSRQVLTPPRTKVRILKRRGLSY